MNKEIEKYLKACQFNQKMYRDYYGSENYTGFQHDKNIHDMARAKSRTLLKRLGHVTEAEFIIASQDAWSGRLEVINGNLHYTPGQFYNLEAPQAMCAVLEAIENTRRQRAVARA